MEEKEPQVRALFKKMLEDGEEYARTLEYYAEDMKDFDAKIQWKFGPIKGYQIFKGTEYSYKMDEEIEDPDATLGCKDLDTSMQFLNNEFADHRDLVKLDMQFATENGEVSADAKRSRLSRMSVGRIPAFRPLLEKIMDPKHSSGTTVAINKSLGTFENQPLPLAVVEHFVNKASHIFLYDKCGCRVNNKCENHDWYETGCVGLGRGVLRTNMPGHIATKEEAMDRARLAVADGLVPSFGRFKADVIAYGVSPDLGDFMILCYCCSCCCMISGYANLPRDMRRIQQKMEGVTVTVNSELCTGCEECLDVCIFQGMKMVDGVAEVDQAYCFGCGRCERVCSPGAINITMEEDSVERMIARIEAHVDIT